MLGALGLVVIGFGLWQAKQPSLEAIGPGFGLERLASAFLGAAVPVVLFLGTGVVGFGLVVASRPER